MTKKPYKVIGVGATAVAGGGGALIGTLPISFIKSIMEGTDGEPDFYTTFNVGDSQPLINISISTDAAWVAWSLVLGVTDARVQLTYTTSALAPGDYTAHVTITADNALNSPYTIPISLHVEAAATSMEVLSASVAGGSRVRFTLSDASAEYTGSDVLDFAQWQVFLDGSWHSPDSLLGSGPGYVDLEYVLDLTNTHAPVRVLGNIAVFNNGKDVADWLGALDMSASPSSLVFTVAQGGSPAPQDVDIIANGAFDIGAITGSD